MFRKQPRIQPFQVKALAARQNGHGNLADFRGGEDEFDVWRWFFQRLEQRVESALRQHVHFVDDVDLCPHLDGRIAHALDDLAHVVDAGVGRRVHLDHVDVPGLENRFALRCKFRHLHRRAGRIIEGTGNQAGGRRLAHAAHPRQHVGLRDAAR